MKRKLVFATILVILLILSYFYFFIISPVFVSKPKLEKPIFKGKVEEKHVEWVVNELGAYRLRANSEIEVIVDGEEFTVSVVENKPVVKKGKAKDPDVRIYANTQVFKRIFESEDFKTELLKLYDEGLVRIEVLKPPEELILKGYKAIYDELQK